MLGFELAHVGVNCGTGEEAVRTANRAGGIVVGKLGTASVSYSELFGDQ